jgi:MarR family protein
MSHFETPTEVLGRGVPPSRSLRRSIARRASGRRATARRRQVDISTTVLAFLAKHPGSTVGDLAKSLNLSPGSVADCVTRLTTEGEIEKAAHGYRRSDGEHAGGGQVPPLAPHAPE